MSILVWSMVYTPVIQFLYDDRGTSRKAGADISADTGSLQEDFYDIICSSIHSVAHSECTTTNLAPGNQEKYYDMMRYH